MKDEQAKRIYPGGSTGTISRFCSRDRQGMGNRDCTPLRMCEGVAFSILGLLDGVSVGIPGFALVPSPHPDDMQYHKDNGENWYPSEEVTKDIREDVMLHEEFYKEHNG